MTKDTEYELMQLAEAEANELEKTAIYRIFEKLYPWQHDFIANTAEYRTVMLMAANRIGKTYTGVYLDAIHALGDYPDDWEGHIFEKPPICWVLGVSGESIRDVLQSPLFGIYSGGQLTGGLIPLDRIIDVIPMGGVSGVVREVRIRHKSGGVSSIKFWSYSQGQHVLMGSSVDFYHIDEEPKDSKIWPQVMIRTLEGDGGKGGRGILTFTPENGRTELVIKFMDNIGPDQCLMRARWSDAPHITPEMVKSALFGLPEYQHKMRSEGEPLMGQGLYFDLPLMSNVVNSFPIPKHFLLIQGVDFGWDCPTGVVQIAIEREHGRIFVTHCYKGRKQQPFEIWEATKRWSRVVPMAWPHDGHKHELGSGLETRQHFEDAGFALLSEKATHPSGGNGVEIGLQKMYEMIKLQKLLFFPDTTDLIMQMQHLHTDEKGKLVKGNDDLIDALRYAIMMSREARMMIELDDNYNDDEYDKGGLVEAPNAHW